MRVDHVTYAAEREGLAATAERLSSLLGVKPCSGGVHPRFGTRNMILPLEDHRYLEVVEALDHPVADKVPFGQIVRARSECGGGWIGWVMQVDDMAEVEQRLGRSAVDGNRTRPDGVELRWRQLGIRGLQQDPQLPFFVEWDQAAPHPSGDGPTETALLTLQIAGEVARVREWIGVPTDFAPKTINFDFVAPHGTPGLLSCTFRTPTGDVTI